MIKFAAKNKISIRMKRYILSLSLLFSAALMFTSCLSDDDNTSTTYNDAAITSFSLGTVNKYIPVLDSVGNTVLKKSTYTGSSYKFEIDQVNGLIYNTDSLPYGTDLKHILCTISTLNGGYVQYFSAKGDSTISYSSSDSIDFSSPRSFRVISNDGSTYRRYTIKVNAHTQQPNQFVWSKLSDNTVFASMQGMRLLILGDDILVLGNSDGATSIYSSKLADGKVWNIKTPNVEIPFDADAFHNAVVCKDKIYLLSAHHLFVSQDAQVWDIVGTTDIKQLIGASTAELYAINSQNQLVSSTDGGMTWQEELLDADASLLPTDNISITTRRFDVTGNTEYVLLVGTRSPDIYPNDTHAFVWSKNVGEKQAKWTMIPQTQSKYYAPNMQGLTTFINADAVYAIGGADNGNRQSEGFTKFFQTRDGGITWKENKHYIYPAEFSSNTHFAVTSDIDDNIWLIGGGSGQVWRGRLNSIGWTTE